MGSIFSYTGEAAKTKEMIEEGRKDITLNTLYKHSRGFYWKVNSRGYIHVILPGKVTLNGKFSHYEVQDYLLTGYNTLRVKSAYGNYDTRKECIEEIEKELCGKEIIQHIYNSEEVILSAKTRSLIERLSEVRQDRGASAAEEQTAKAKIEKLRAKANNQTEKIKVTDHYPEYQPNPPRMSWHIEKDGVIIAKGNGVAKFSDMKYFDKEGYEKDLKECDKNSYRYERAEKLLKLAKQFEKFMNKIDSAAGCMIGGNGKAYVYTNVETVEYKTENKAVECPGSLRANQCFVVKSCFNHGISKGYVYQLNEHEGVNGEKYYIAYRLDKKLKKQLTGNANPANCFGYISGSYKERFLKWIETGALAWCEIQEVKTPYKVQKCVKKKIG